MLIVGVSASSVKLPVVQPPETLLVLALTLVTCMFEGVSLMCRGRQRWGSRAVQAAACRGAQAHLCRTDGVSTLGLGEQEPV